MNKIASATAPAAAAAVAVAAIKPWRICFQSIVTYKFISTGFLFVECKIFCILFALLLFYVWH